MAKFTPGPWGLGTSKVAIWASDGAMVADAWESNDRPDYECEANAKLIAAAPEMYTCLVKMRDGMNCICRLNKIMEPLGASSECHVCAINAILDKADGGQQ